MHEHAVDTHLIECLVYALQGSDKPFDVAFAELTPRYEGALSQHDPVVVKELVREKVAKNNPRK